MADDLPAAECRLGYPWRQLDGLLGARTDELGRWLNGQTLGLCDGREYDPAADKYRTTGCGPHGAVVYRSDLRRFLAGHPITDRWGRHA